KLMELNAYKLIPTVNTSTSPNSKLKGAVQIGVKREVVSNLGGLTGCGIELGLLTATVGAWLGICCLLSDATGGDDTYCVGARAGDMVLVYALACWLICISVCCTSVAVAGRCCSFVATRREISWSSSRGTCGLNRRTDGKTKL